MEAFGRPKKPSILINTSASCHGRNIWKTAAKCDYFSCCHFTIMHYFAYIDYSSNSCVLSFTFWVVRRRCCGFFVALLFQSACIKKNVCLCESEFSGVQRRVTRFARMDEVEKWYGEAIIFPILIFAQWAVFFNMPVSIHYLAIYFNNSTNIVL